jgi:hypothetical protein
LGTANSERRKADLPEHAVLAIKPGSGNSAQEELASIRVGPGVGHGQNSGAGVLEGEVLILELLAVDGLATRAVSPGEVTSLAHELRDDAVEAGSLEVEGLAAASGALRRSHEEGVS